MAVAGLWHYNVHSCRVTADREWLLSGSVMDERALSKAAPRLASPRWRCEWGCDSPFPSLCRCLCSRPRQRQRSTWAQHTDLPATESGRHSRCSSRLYHQFWSSSPSPSSIGTWAETDPWSCSCTSCSSDPLSGQWRLVHLHLGFFFSRKPKKPFDAFSSDDSAFLHCNRPLYGSLLHTYGGYMDLYCIYACEHNKQLMWQLWWMHCAHVCCCHFSAALTTDDSDDLRDFRSQLKKNTHTHILKLND